jgi:formylglycine-generating enzyme required for sulfatase activity
VGQSIARAGGGGEEARRASGEVTQRCYDAVVNSNQQADKKISRGYADEFKGTNHPVVMVSCGQAKQFCKTLGSQEAERGRQYPLPTEAQWEYACRAGSETPFAFGETISPEQANYHGHYTYGDGQKRKNREQTLPACSFAPNAWGLYDMHGNVTECCAGRYRPHSSHTVCGDHRRLPACHPHRQPWTKYR